MSDYITVSVLNNYLKNIVDAESLLHNISVVGEISQLKVSGAHAYFVMKDENSEISCTLFNYRNSEYLPKHGETVLATGSVDYYVKGGRLTFKVRKTIPVGEGAIAMRLEALKKRLAESGYFDDKHKKSVPRFCENVCVITAKTGAVIRDIITTARKNNRLLNIDVFPVKVQGEGSALSVINALKTVDKMGYDAIIIARGGGSLEDLMGFNDELLVYAIFDAVTPVISAVGHETDYTLCDFAADVRVPTPTAAAELVAFNVYDLTESIFATIKYMANTVSGKYDRTRNEFCHLTRRIAGAGKYAASQNRSKIEAITKRMNVAAGFKADLYRNRINNFATRIEQNNPMKILRQGYYKLTVDGVELKSEQIKIGDEVVLTGSAAKIKADVKEVVLCEETVL